MRRGDEHARRHPDSIACETIGDREIQGLSDVLIDCVEGGASVSFMLPMTRAKAEAFWRSTSASVARGERVVLAAEDADGTIVGTVQVIWAQPENQPHRGDIAKMLVHRRARRRGRRRGAARRRRAQRARRRQDAAGARYGRATTPSACMRGRAGSVAGKFRITRCCPMGRPVRPRSSSRSWAA